MPSRPTTVLLLVAAASSCASGCDRSAAQATDASSPAVVSSTSASITPDAAPMASPTDAGASERSFRGYQGKIGSEPFRMVLERSGKELHGLYTRGENDTRLEGEMKD